MLALRRLSPLLFLAATLVALAVLLVHDSPPALADHQEPDAIWTATLTTIADTPAGVGCNNDLGATYTCTSTARLTDDDFTYDGVTYSITAIVNIHVSGVARTTIGINPAPPAALRAIATLHANGRIFSLADATLGDSNRGFAWTRPASEGLPSFATGGVSRVVDFQLTVPGTTPPSGVTLGGSNLDTSRGEGHFDLAINEGDFPGGRFTVALTDDPGASVTVNLVKTQYNQSGVGADDHIWNANAATVEPATLTFTSSNYSQGQTVTVNAPNDDNSCHEQLIILVLKSATGQSDVAPVGGSSSSVTGVYVTIDDDEGGSCGGV